MKATLALITCGPQLEVALALPDRPVASLVRLAGGSPRSRLLLAAVDLLLADAGVEPGALERVAVSRGPGSFTGIRAGLATAAGLEAAVGATTAAWDSLTVQAARALLEGTVWTAQPGRRGEVYAQRFRVAPERPPEPEGPVEVMPVASARERSPWIAVESLELSGAVRVGEVRTAAEALLSLVRLGVPSQPVEPLYVEGPPIHRGVSDG